jgi:hypothetical protein
LGGIVGIATCRASLEGLEGEVLAGRLITSRFKTFEYTYSPEKRYIVTVFIASRLPRNENNDVEET